MPVKNLLHIVIFLLTGSISLFAQTKSLGEIDERVLYLKERDGLSEQIEKARKDSSLTNFSHTNQGLKLFIVKESGKTVKMVEWYFFDDYLIYTESNWWNP